MKVSVIIVNYNTGVYLNPCISSVLKHENKNDVEFIIVDNASKDDSTNIIDSLCREYRNIHAVYLDENKGYGYANNRGAEKANGEYLLILNPDIMFSAPLIEKLIETSRKNKDIGAAGVRLYSEDGNFQYGYYQKYPSITQYFLFYSILSKPFINSAKLKNKYLNFLTDDEIPSELTDVPQLPGAFIFIRKDIYTEYGGFDEKYFLFFEDVDLSYRLSGKFRLSVLNGLKVFHSGSSSMEIQTNYKIYGYFILSFKKFFRLNYGTFRYYYISLAIFKNSLLKIMLESVKTLFGKSDPNVILVHKYILKHFNS
jgi:N-acetylglucosaminyl-diphospho-decaprenol L-rhamnosyltransferase